MLDLKNSAYADVRPHKRTLLHRFELWMINDGKQYVYFGFWILIQVLMYSLAFVNYNYHPQWQNAHNMLGTSFLTARSAALALHVDTALVLFPICRTVISWIRTTPLNRVIPFDHATLFHMVIGYSIVFFTLVHAGSHYHNYWEVSKQTGTPYWKLVFATGHGLTGHIMMICILAMGITGYEKVRRKHFNLFWNVHHLFVVYFACFSIHGVFCLLKPNEPPYCTSGGSFWKYWIASGVVYLFERLSREFRANRRSSEMKVQKVILHPGKVIEVQFRKPRGFKGLAGQYAFLNCPAVSTQQWHPFTLTSAPEEDYVSMHIRVCGDWTRAFSDALGAKAEHWKALEASLGDAEARNRQQRSNRALQPRTASQVNERPATGGAEPGRDSMSYAPIPRRRTRKNTALSANRPNTMLLVDQTDEYDHEMPMMPNGVSPHPMQRNTNGLMSRLSYYLGGSNPGGAGGAARQSRASSVGNSHYQQHQQFMSTKDAEQMPKMPSLKQLQEYYLKEGREAEFQMPHQQRLNQQDQASSPSIGGAGSTVVDDQDMNDLKAIVNSDDLESIAFRNSSGVRSSGGMGGEVAVAPHLHANILPQVLVDGPFGSASEDVFNHEIAMLFCAGIGCTPFASVLKSIWYRLSYPEGSFRLRKVYFFWVQRDTKSFEWFQDLLKAIEEEDDARMEMDENMHAYSLTRPTSDKMIEIHTYLTGRLNMTQMTHVHLNEGELDPITGLKSPTNFGRPNMDLIFRAVAHEHPATDVGVFFCGPVKLGSSIESSAKKWSSEGQDGTKFYYNKENF